MTHAFSNPVIPYRTLCGVQDIRAVESWWKITTDMNQVDCPDCQREYSYYSLHPFPIEKEANMLLKSEVLVHRRITLDGEVTFDVEYDDDNQGFPEITISTAMWKQMGSPETLTLTIEPGDKLNIPGFVYRDSVTGEFVTEEYALANPDTTQREQA